MNNALLSRKLRLIERLHEEREDHVWDVFSRYIAIEPINFNGPNTWAVSGDSIEFNGEDGCRGCYDPMSLSIPMKFFTDTEASFNALTQEKQAEQQRMQAARLNAIEQQERQQYERLRAKFEANPKEASQ